MRHKNAMTELGFRSLLEAPASILGVSVILLHGSGATEACVLETKEQAKTAVENGWTRYRVNE